LTHRHPVTSEVSEAVFDFFRRVFLLEPPCEPVSYRAEWLDFLMRWQQFSGAVMAKGLEDTAFFVHHGLLSLNEVGCNPFRRGIRFGVAAFHESNRRRQKEYPFSLNATSTHDTKWSEDVRARINVLSEIPQEWRRRLAHWSKLNHSKKTEVAGRLAPSPNEEVLLYQALLGIWPFTEPNLDEIRERIDGFLLKAVREAKTHSNWFSPNEPYEAAIREFLAAVVRPEPNAFLRDFLQFFEEIASRGACNAWSQVLVKMTSPGIPDFYQGNGLWQFRLTDPDNRNVVDYRERGETMESLLGVTVRNEGLCPRQLLENWRDGSLKLYLAQKVLNFRRAHKQLFMQGKYLPLRATGPHKERLCSYVRQWEGEWAITVVSRLAATLSEPGVFPVGEAVWAGNSIVLPQRAPSGWTNLLTGESITALRHSIPLTKILSDLPFAFLVAEK